MEAYEVYKLRNCCRCRACVLSSARTKCERDDFVSNHRLKGISQTGDESDASLSPRTISCDREIEKSREREKEQIMHLGQIGFVFCALVSSLALGARREEDLDGGNGQEEPDRRLRHRRPCGARRTCDLRSQYCDDVLGECASCADDCHPGRIRGDAVATNECRVICERKCCLDTL